MKYLILSAKGFITLLYSKSDEELSTLAEGFQKLGGNDLLHISTIDNLQEAKRIFGVLIDELS